MSAACRTSCNRANFCRCIDPRADVNSSLQSTGNSEGRESALVKSAGLAASW